MIEELGPTALVYPSLRGLPLLDRWLRELGIRDVDNPSLEQRRAPCLPNRFLAVVPFGSGGESARRLADDCRDCMRKSWMELCKGVRHQLAREVAKLDDSLSRDWDRLWDSQTADYFQVSVAVTPWKDCDDACLADLLRGQRGDDADAAFKAAFPAAAIRGLSAAIPKELLPGGYPQRTAGQWQHRLELAAKTLEALKNVRHFPSAAELAVGPFARKCSLLGSFGVRANMPPPCALGISPKTWPTGCRRFPMAPPIAGRTACGGAY